MVICLLDFLAAVTLIRFLCLQIRMNLTTSGINCLKTKLSSEMLFTRKFLSINLAMNNLKSNALPI